jgi:thiamine biosynthesis lipoprotein
VKADAPGATVGVAVEGAPGLDVRRFAADAMNTVFEVLCAHPDARYAGQAAQAAFEEVRRLEQELSRFRPNSDVSRVSTLGAGEATRVSPPTMECLAIARVLYELTAGTFDVSIGTGLDGLDLDPEALSVHVRRDGVRLDLGGIGKGYAVDRMAEVLDEWGIQAALLHGGFSSVLALDPPPGTDGWPLTLSAPGPADAVVLARLSVRHLALSASGTRKGDHVVDTRSGRPVRGRAAWAAVPSRTDRQAEAAAEGWPDLERSPATVAEGLSTAFMIMEKAEIDELCRRAPGVEAWLVGEAPPGGRTALSHLGTPASRCHAGPPGADGA